MEISRRLCAEGDNLREARSEVDKLSSEKARLEESVEKLEEQSVYLEGRNE